MFMFNILRTWHYWRNKESKGIVVTVFLSAQSARKRINRKPTFRASDAAATHSEGPYPVAPVPVP